MKRERVVTAGGTPVERWEPPQARGGVVLLSEVFGVNEPLRGYAAKLVDLGFVVAMPDFWWRESPPPMSTHEEIAAAVDRIADGQAMSDVAAGRVALGIGAPHFVLGFCMGGLFARMAACVLPGLAGAVEFYGRVVYPVITVNKPVQPLDLLPGLCCPLQVHVGTDDALVPAGHVAELERRLGSRVHASMVFRYQGCRHAFMNPERPGWRPDAAATAWGRVVNFLEHMAAPGR